MIGLFLFATGLVALFAVSSPIPAQPIAPTTADAITLATPTQTNLTAGIHAAVERVLLESGRAGALSADEMSQVPPHVLRVLVENGAALIVSDGGVE